MTRMEELARVITADENKMKALFALEPEEAAKELAKEGYDFTVEELIAFGNLIKQAKESKNDGELDENELDNVAGGGVGMALLIGVAVGYFIYEKKW